MTRKTILAMVATLIVALTGQVEAADELDNEQTEFFESKIRPIFVEHCYECHSVAADQVEAGLLLDSKWGWQSGGDSGPAIEPGKPDASLVIHAVRYEEDVVSAMPPRSKLSDDEISLLEKWVTQGAPDPRPKAQRGADAAADSFDLPQRVADHWSWRPVVKPKVPTVHDTSWPLTDADRFILAGIEAAGLKPAPPADRETWLRRVHFDLIGLPPTIEQLDRFLADRSTGAHERVVRELIESPHFGEKWARHWMDLVRYAETHGHEFDYPINRANEYRDYLIRAFNADVPYDQLVREHIAGDLLIEPRRHLTEDYNESIIGTGYWYLHEATHAPTDVLGNEADIVDNQIDVFGKTFLGLTVACARCHDHKFDAISTTDYYALSAYLQSSCRQMYPLDPGRRIATATHRIRELRKAAIASLRTVRIDQDRLDPSRYYRAAAKLIRGESESRLAINDDGKLSLPDEDVVARETAGTDLEGDRLNRWLSLLTSVDLRKPTDTAEAALALAVMDPSGAEIEARRHRDGQHELDRYRKDSTLLVDFGDTTGKLPPGWSTSGSAFVAVADAPTLPLDGWRARPGTVDSSFHGRKQAGILRSPTFEITSSQIHILMRATANVQVNVIIDNYQMAPFNALLFRGTFKRGGESDTKGLWQWKTLGGDLRKYVGHKAYLEFVDQADATIAIKEVRFSDRPPPTSTVETWIADLCADRDALRRLWQRSIADLAAGRHSELLEWLLDKQLIGLKELSGDAVDTIAEAVKIASGLPQPRYVIAMAEGTTESAHVYVRGSHTSLGKLVPPRSLQAFGGQPGNRLVLARQIANADNPLTSRVIVNRVWHHLFGRGIVPTVDDFGPQGQAPSHPEMLDWLASDFVERGWSLKTLIAQLVLSQTYRQSSIADPNLSRETIATVDPTNRLLHRMSVRRLPAESIRDGILAVSGRLDPRLFGGSVPTHRNEFMTGRGARPSGPLDGNGRRSVYLSVYRNFLNPFLLAFDMPSPFGPKGRRSLSNVPAQALTLMNDPFVVQQAELFAKRIGQQRDLTETRRIERMMRLAHGVTPEAKELQTYQEFLRRQTEQHGGDAERAWTDLAHALFNMKAFYFLR